MGVELRRNSEAVPGALLGSILAAAMTFEINAAVADRPKSLADPAVRADRRTQLHEPHIAPLTAFVESLRDRIGPDVSIPYFDPWDGGIDAAILFLLEAPGAKAVLSGFVSRNNPDETAKNFFQLNAQAGIPRKRTIIWNVVPWYIGDGNRIRAADKADMDAGIRELPGLFSLLPRLHTVVLIGRKAQNARGIVKHLLPTAAVFDCAHPSPQYLNTDPANRQHILDVLRQVARFAISCTGAEMM